MEAEFKAIVHGESGAAEDVLRLLLELRLFTRPRAHDEDIHESLGTLLPVGS